MKGFLHLLAKAKLVELSADERQATGLSEPARDTSEPTPSTPPLPPLPAEDPFSLPPPTSAAAPLVAHTAAPAGAPVDIPFAEIYRAAGVPPSAYPAEKLLRLLDGLRVMDPATRKAAVLAMDAADDNWQIGDCINDAQCKMAALAAYCQQSTASMRQHEQQSGELAEQIKVALNNATSAIRQQIAELEALLQREIARAAQETANLEQGLRATREAAQRDQQRVEAEIERLREILLNFADAGSIAHTE